jgi:hypothetical protein
MNYVGPDLRMVKSSRMSAPRVDILGRQNPTTCSTNQRHQNSKFHMQTFLIYKAGFNQNYCTFALNLLMKIVLCSQFHWTKLMDHKCFITRFARVLRAGGLVSAVCDDRKLILYEICFNLKDFWQWSLLHDCLSIARKDHAVWSTSLTEIF